MHLNHEAEALEDDFHHRLTHFNGNFADPLAKVGEADFRMVREKRHGYGGVGDLFGNHKVREVDVEGVVVVGGVPD